MIHHRTYRLFTFNLDLGVMVTQNVAEYLPHHVTHGPGKFEHYFTLTLGLRHARFCQVPSTSCDFFRYKVWSCYIWRFRRRYIYKKYIIWLLTLTFWSRSHEMFTSNLSLRWPNQVHSWKLLRLSVLEIMHLQENTLFDLWPWPRASRLHEMLPRTICLLRPNQVQSSKLLRLMV